MPKVESVHVHTYVGREIDPYIPHLARLRIEVFKEWPYLYDGAGVDDEKKYLKKFSRCDLAIFVVAFDGENVIGVSAGLPFTFETTPFQQPFIEAKLELTDYFYLSESVLLKPYRGQGIGHEFFNMREDYVKRLSRFHHIIFAAVERDKNDPRRPKDHFDLDAFWKKRGYVKQPEMVCHVPWKEVGEENPSPKPLVYWKKDI